MNESLRLRFSGGMNAPARARTALRSLDRTLADVKDDVDILVSELVTNSVRHAGSDLIELEARTSPTTVRVEVGDSGPGFDRQDPPEPDPDRVGGYGLYLVDRLANRWGVERTGGTRVWFEIDRNGHRRT
jgi:anti-sigma regulatory factor (Ser/Thr protein kinase)